MIKSYYGFAPPSSGRRPWFRNGAAVAVGLMLAPVVYEAGLLCAADWCALRGKRLAVETPVLNALESCRRVASRWAWESIDALFIRLPWEPWLVIGLGLSIAALMSLHLRHRW